LRPLRDEGLRMSPGNRRFRLARGDLQHPPRKFVLNERAIPWDGLKSGFVQRFLK
jgi:hypothetical protein